MKLLFIASECWPLVKVGGLADVVGSLSKVLKDQGVEVSVVIPFYPEIELEEGELEKVEKDFSVPFAGQDQEFSVYKTHLFENKVPAYLLKKKKYFFEKGVYNRPDASPKGSLAEAEKFLFLSRAGLEIAAWKKAEIIHCHDWQTGVIPFLVKKLSLPFKTLLTVHNLGYQGVYPSRMVNNLLDTDFSEEKVNCLRLGILNADLINTVSPTYAKEILTKRFGCGLEKDLRKRSRDLYGILNGLDQEAWNPEKDPYLVQNYSSDSLEKKKKNKISLQRSYFGKSSVRTPLIGMVSRLATQKGVGLVKQLLPSLVEKEVQFILLGKGIEFFERYFKVFSYKHPDKFQAEIGFDEELAHRIYAGVDMFLIPSFYEPCGLGQQIAMKYGAVPIGRSTGGIRDTVEDTKFSWLRKKPGTGFLYDKPGWRPLWRLIKKSLRAYENKEFWTKIQKKGMNQDLSWDSSAQKYMKLYNRLLRKEG